MFEIEKLKSKDEKEYERLVKASRNGMLYHSIKWKCLLEKLTDTQPLYTVAKRDGKIVGALPTFKKQNKEYGNILNSLPFYGSHGGVIVSPSLTEQQRNQVKKKLLATFKQLAEDNDCITSTLIMSLFENDPTGYEKILEPDFVDMRTGQFTVLRQTVDVEREILYNTVEKRCRVAIRKARKSGVKVEFTENLKNFDIFYEMHKIGILNKNGIPKPMSFFENAFKIFDQNKSFKILLARKNGEIIAGLLLFYYKNMVEYFTPCFKLEYSEFQPLSLLIYEAMKDSIERGYTVWNFGGTWQTQHGVHMFKRSFGAKELPYYYYINCYRNIDPIKMSSLKILLNQYKWFYVLPFSELRTRGRLSS